MYATAAHLLSRQPARATPSVSLLPGATRMPLAKGRVHEACGAARHMLALWLAAQIEGPILWITPEWSHDHLNPCGVLPMLDPARFLFVTPRRPEDVLWTMEETLRAGAVAYAVADLPGLPSLTAVRRMHLAAETGGAEGDHLPLGLLLTPGYGGAQGVETRWHLSPDHQGTAGQWRLSRLRARTAPQHAWRIQRRKGQALPVVEGPLALPADPTLARKK